MTAEGQDVLLEVHVHPVDENEVETITAATHAQTRVEDVGDQEGEAMTHEIRVDEERSRRKRQSQVVMVAGPEIVPTSMLCKQCYLTWHLQLPQLRPAIHVAIAKEGTEVANWDCAGTGQKENARRVTHVISNTSGKQDQDS